MLQEGLTVERRLRTQLYQGKEARTFIERRLPKGSGYECHRYFWSSD